MTQPITADQTAIRLATAKGRQTRAYPMISGDRRMIGGAIPFRVLSFIRDTNPDLIGYDIYNLMRRYPTIHAALVLRTAPILSQIRKAQVKSDDEARRRFIEATFIDSGLVFRLAQTSLRALAFGAAFHELQWDTPDLELVYTETDEAGNETEVNAWSGPATVIKEAHEVNPDTIKEIRRRTKADPARPDQVADRSYDGFIQRPIAGSTDDIVIEAVNSFIHTYDLEFDNMWGRPLTANAYPFYYWANAMMKLWMAWAEKKVIPPRVVYFPVGESITADGSDRVDHASIALDTGNMIDGVNAVALPGTVTDGKREWEIAELPVTERTDAFERIIHFLNVEMLHAMFIPERVFTEGQYGTKAEAESHFDTLLMVEENDLYHFVEDINKFLIPRVVALNFGDGASVELTVAGLTDDARALMRTTFVTLLTNADMQQKVDFDAIAAALGVPVKEITAVAGADPNAPIDPLAPPVDPNAPPAAPADTTVIPPNLALDENDIIEAMGEALAAFADGDMQAMGDITDGIDLIQLAALVDLSQYKLIPDATSILKYRVMKGNRRISGFAARAVIRAFETQASKAAKSAETAGNKAKRAADSAAKQAANAAKAAATKAQTAAARELKRLAAEQKRLETAAARAGTKAERDKARADLAANRKAQTEAKAKTKADTAAAVTKDKAHAAQITDAAKADAATVTEARTQKTALESTTSKQPTAAAVASVKAAGWQADDTNQTEHAAAVDAASAAATANPDRVYTIVKTAAGFMVISKPKTALKPKEVARNVAADDDDPDEGELDDDDTGYDSTNPDEVADVIMVRAGQTIAALFRQHDPSDDDEVEDSDTDDEV